VYPYVDEAAGLLATTDHQRVPETKVIGNRWSGRSSEVREFLARNQVPYRCTSQTRLKGQRLSRRRGER